MITLEIETLSSNGDGIARHDGIVHFVPRTLPGERCEADVVHSTAHWRRAHVRRLLEVSPDRVEPPCPIYNECGGCQLQHMAYARQLEFKRDAVRETLRRVAHIDVEPAPTVPSAPFGYRRKISLSVLERGSTSDHTSDRARDGTRNSTRDSASDGNVAVLGLHRWDDPAAVVRVERCPLLVDELNDTLPAVEAWLNSGELAWCRPSLRRVVLRLADDQPVVVLACDPVPPRPRYPDKIPLPPGIAAAFCAKRPEGIPAYHIGAGPQVPLYPGAFAQANAEIARALYNAAIATAGEGSTTIIDAYAGAGILAEQLGHKGHNVAAIELDRDAVAAARRRIQAAGLRKRVIVRRGRVEDLLPDHLPADLVILDPPRAGCHARVIRALVENPPARIAYISCHAAAFARDARRLLDAGRPPDGRRPPNTAYRLDRLTPFDMFPQTHHVELLAVLQTTSPVVNPGVATAEWQ